MVLIKKSNENCQSNFVSKKPVNINGRKGTSVLPDFRFIIRKSEYTAESINATMVTNSKELKPSPIPIVKKTIQSP